MESISTFHCKNNSINGFSYAITTPEELLHIIVSADHAHASGIWQNLDIREAFFPLLIEEIERNKAPLREVYCAESSLSPARFEREYQRMLRQITSYAREGIAWAQRTETTVLVDKTLSKKWIPVGPVVVFGASNFPLAYGTLGGDTIGALAAGCPVIVKGHPYHAGTSSLLSMVVSRVLNDLKLPRGIFNHVLDEGFLAGQQLIMDERIKAGAFTGSMNGGMSLYRLAQQRKSPIPFFAEMGSLNPVIWLNDVKSVVKNLQDLARSVTEDAGQFCTKPGLMLFPIEELDALSTIFREAMERSESYPMLHPEIYRKYNSRLEEIQQVKHVTRFSNNIPWNADRAFAQCTLQEFLATKVLHHEVFGPFTCLIGYERLEDVEALFPCIGGQLTVSFFGMTPTTEHVWKVAEQFAGRMIINGVPTGVEVESTMNHGGPFPATTDVRYSSVGEASISRFFRTITVQKSLKNL